MINYLTHKVLGLTLSIPFALMLLGAAFGYWGFALSMFCLWLIRRSWASAFFGKDYK